MRTVLLTPRVEHQIAPGVVHFAVLTTVAEGEVTQDGQLVAKAVVQFSLLTPS